MNPEKFLYNNLGNLFQKRRWDKIERKTIALTLMMLTVFSIVGALTATSFATDTTSDTNSVDVESQTNEAPFLGIPEMMLSEQGFGGGPGCRAGHRGGGPGGMTNIELSTEYTDAVNAILEADTDIQTLIAEGYNVTSIRPKIASVVEADGTIVTSATTAVVKLENGTSGYAIANVEISEAQVTQIVIFTRTVIDKTTS
ncbi:MAG: hypothetical protein P8Y18_00085 [Candidatus Bathyarchaeota archaeon]